MSLSRPRSDQQQPSEWRPKGMTNPQDQRQDQQDQQQENRPVKEAKEAIKGANAFWTKLNNDWVFNLAAMLAYNLLMSIVPILALILGIFGLFVSGLAPQAQQQFISGISKALPGAQDFVSAALNRLAQSSGILTVITIIVSAWFGSRLFTAIEQCFGIIYRLPMRKFIRQNIVALSMMVLFVILIPIMLAVSAAPSFLSSTVVDRFFANSEATRVWLVIAGCVAGFVIASLLFLVIYIVMPNRPMRVQDAWRGALIAGALLEVYDIAFPYYTTHFLKPNSYGSTAGFAVLILVFFYYFGVILLLGAEINSFWAGQRQTATALPGILYEVQVRRSIEGAAGPTAGQPQEDLQADHTGLDITMTPAADVLHPPSEEEQAQRIEQREEYDQEKTAQEQDEQREEQPR